MLAKAWRKALSRGRAVAAYITFRTSPEISPASFSTPVLAILSLYFSPLISFNATTTLLGQELKNGVADGVTPRNRQRRSCETTF